MFLPYLSKNTEMFQSYLMISGIKNIPAANHKDRRKLLSPACLHPLKTLPHTVMQLDTPSEVAMAVSTAVIICTTNFHVSRFIRISSFPFR